MAQHCLIHTDEETLLSCSNCGDPYCMDCLTNVSVGARCPKCLLGDDAVVVVAAPGVFPGEAPSAGAVKDPRDLPPEAKQSYLLALLGTLVVTSLLLPPLSIMFGLLALAAVANRSRLPYWPVLQILWWVLLYCAGAPMLIDVEGSGASARIAENQPNAPWLVALAFVLVIVTARPYSTAFASLLAAGRASLAGCLTALFYASGIFAFYLAGMVIF